MVTKPEGSAIQSHAHVPPGMEPPIGALAGQAWRISSMGSSAPKKMLATHLLREQAAQVANSRRIAAGSNPFGFMSSTIGGAQMPLGAAGKAENMGPTIGQKRLAPSGTSGFYSNQYAVQTSASQP